MAKQKTKPRRRILRGLLIAITSVVVFLLLFVVAFVWNPLEGSLPELRDVVPRGVNFFVRKQRLAADFSEFPEPKFWASFAEIRGFDEFMKGGLVAQARSAGAERALQQAKEAFDRVRADSKGWLDPLRDVFGEEVIVAGYELDYTQQPARPLSEPWWCCYARVSWRVRFGHGVLGFGLAQDQLRKNGIDVTQDGDLLVLKLPGMPTPLYVKRHLDALMVGNHKLLFDQSQRLIDGNRDEDPIGQMPAYKDGAIERIDRWASHNDAEPPNVLEFVVEPNAFDGFRRFAAKWPNPDNRESMNERVLARFLNLKGWEQVTGGLLFTEGGLVATGQVGLNSRQHTPFQSTFYQAEQRKRDEWLDPFLAMVPASACAAAALRMPVGDFLYSMFDALDQPERDLLNDRMKRLTFQGAQLNDTRDLIEKLKPAFLLRTGFVFRRNTPDRDRDEKGNLKVPVTALSPMPQFAWVFWLRPGAAPMVEDFVKTMRQNFQSLGFLGVWNLKVTHGASTFPEPVSEFTNPQIPATGSIAMIVFSDFFVVSNSGPFVRDILTTRYSAQTGAKSLRDMPEFLEVERDLLGELNGLVWLHGDNLLPVLDDYRTFADAASEMPDPEWMARARATAEEQVRRASFPQYPSKASMPRTMTDPGGDFDRAVVSYLQEKWRTDRTSFTASDRQQMEQLRAAVQMMRSACVQVELTNNYIRFLARVMGQGR
ncbi:MAG: hypothetical protein JNK78_15775 [Planctomycetes bacterium]|nr:hypothetical protein [Planctomycetota bacterium]